MFFQTNLVQNFGKTFYPFPIFYKRISNSILRKIVRLGGLANKKNLGQFRKLMLICEKLENITGVTSPDTGNEIIKQSYQKLNQIVNVDFEFKGFIEGNHLMDGDVNVIVADGFTGNIALKTAEGTSNFIISELKSALSSSFGLLGFLPFSRRLISSAVKVQAFASQELFSSKLVPTVKVYPIFGVPSGSHVV